MKTTKKSSTDIMKKLKKTVESKYPDIGIKAVAIKIPKKFDMKKFEAFMQLVGGIKVTRKKGQKITDAMFAAVEKEVPAMRKESKKKKKG